MAHGYYCIVLYGGVMNKSYLRWSGGKSRILPQVLDAIGVIYDGEMFIEPFVGSATVAMNVDCDKMLLNDINFKLINAHHVAYNKPDELISACNMLFSLGVDVYSTVRSNFNKSKESYNEIEWAAMFVYLNKHCFNGLYRENNSGGFNVPVDKNATPSVPVNNILNFNQVGKEYTFTSVDFEEVIDEAICADVVYCDPPYPSDSISESEIQYSKDGFTALDHIRLHDAVVRANNRGARCVVSYCDIPFIRNLYRDAHEIIEVEASRSISSKSATRGKAKELIIIYTGNTRCRN